MLTRIIQKGNEKNKNYTIRIIETDGKVYYYLYLNLEDGENTIYSRNPSNMKDVIDVSWDDVPIVVKEAHYKNLYPDDNLSQYEKNCFLYGKQKVDEIAEKKAKEKEEFWQRISSCTIDKWILKNIYNEIGQFDKINILYEKWPKGKYIVDNKYIIQTKFWMIISIECKDEYDAKRKKWGKRVKQIASMAGTSFAIATIVANIEDINEAVKILQQINKILHSKKFISYLKFYSFPGYNSSRIIKEKINEQLPTKYICKLNWNKRFFDSVEKILEKD